MSANKKASGFAKGDDLLLADYSRSISFKNSALLYTNAVIVTLLPLWLFYRIHFIADYLNVYNADGNLSIFRAAFVVAVFAFTTSLASWLVTFAYRKSKHVLKYKVAIKRGAAVHKEMSKKLADDKKISKKEREERILWKKNEVAEYESTTFAIFYNNAFYLACLVFLSFCILRSLSAPANYVVSTLTSAGLIALLSTGTR